jgi:hypothetical protein
VSADRDGRRGSLVLFRARTISEGAQRAREDIFAGGMGDPAAHEVLDALAVVIDVLEPFRRVGRG